jgi:hypothetical protein
MMHVGRYFGEHRLRIMPWVVHVQIGKPSTEDPEPEACSEKSMGVKSSLDKLG